MWKILHHWGLPLFGCVVWWGMLIALMTCWAVQGHPRYSFVSDNKSILFISDVGATNLQPIFIACASTEALCFVLALTAERYLRHAGRLLPNHRRREKVAAGFAIGFGIIGQLGIIFVSTFNTHIFSRVHVSFLLVFLIGTGLSALCTITEYTLIDWSYREAGRIRISYICKGIWFIVCLALAITFGTLSLTDRKNAAAVCEWTLAFIFGFYLLTLVYDLWPAAATQKGELLEVKSNGQLRRSSWIAGDDPHGEMSENYPVSSGENPPRPYPSEII
ncbi:hypothetical protein TRVA0_019S00650 [Trichomonascus vanleenenianus]|uniref:Sfk1p n=1 Tax=Trichomonascus vanleenenianus TaxID=2268995 RepID=UPI003ECB2C07